MQYIGSGNTNIFIIRFDFKSRGSSAKMASTREWITFFQEARIPRSAAAQYAMTFTENRISMDMLMDLNKVRAY